MAQLVSYVASDGSPKNSLIAVRKSLSIEHHGCSWMGCWSRWIASWESPRLRSSSIALWISLMKSAVTLRLSSWMVRSSQRSSRSPGWILVLNGSGTGVSADEWAASVCSAPNKSSTESEIPGWRMVPVWSPSCQCWTTSGWPNKAICLSRLSRVLLSLFRTPGERPSVVIAA